LTRNIYFQCDYVSLNPALRHDGPAMKRVTPRPKKRLLRTFVKEWRKYRGLTQEALADRVGMAVSNIAQLEQGRQGYSQTGLEAIADALQCSPGQLLTVDPTKDDAIWSIWETAKPAERQMIVDIARTLVKRSAS
jgi:transcriptional regulator with XRE-family HTH domain